MSHRIYSIGLVVVLAIIFTGISILPASARLQGLLAMNPSANAEAGGIKPLAAFPAVIEPDPRVQAMIDQVDSTTIYSYTGGLTGDWPVWVGGEWYTITSRYTYSGEPMLKATQWAAEHLAGLGLEVEVHHWDDPYTDHPNVIAELPGLVSPEYIYLIGGHLDAVQGVPGADDNASGSVATLIAADILSQYEWGCTLRFALWTGEEQGVFGSRVYAQRSYDQGENILGYLNLDMIAWNTLLSSPDIDLLVDPNLPPTYELAQLFAEVVEAYGLNLIPEITADMVLSDNLSFSNLGYTAILGIEDLNDFNPYYHTPDDSLEHLDLEYYTEYVKAALATTVHMTGCLEPGGIGHLDGNVSATEDGSPIASALVAAEDSAGRVFTAATDPLGYYTRTLEADVFTVTASAYGYLPATESGVAIMTNTVTTQDFTLQSAPTYTISGTVTEAGSGSPLLAEVAFAASPVVVWSDPATGFYQASLPQGVFTMQVSAYQHTSQERDVLVDHDQTQDFALEPYACVLLVDDDNNAPDVRPYFTAALINLGYGYDIFDVGGGGFYGPALDDLQGHRLTIWFTGDKFGGSAGPNGVDEANLAAYLDGGGRLFLSSQDYLFDFGMTPFGQTYLGMDSYESDIGFATEKYGVAGDPIGDGLGPYTLSYPPDFSDWGDIVNPGENASTAFRTHAGGGRSLDIDNASDDWKTVFFGTDWVGIAYANPANGEQVLERIVDWFGGCEDYPPLAMNDSYDTSEDTPLVEPAPGLLGNDSDADGDPLTAVLDSPPAEGQLSLAPDGSFVYTPTLDFHGGVTFTYHANDGIYDSNVAIVAIEVASINDPPLVEAGPDQAANEGQPVVFAGSFNDPGYAARLAGGEEIRWDFGDGMAASGTLTPTHAFGDNGVFTVTLTITDSAGGAGSDTLLVTTGNLPPSLEAGPDQSALVGDAVVVVATFSDPGWGDTHAARINWGDGVVEPALVDPQAGTISGSHAYADPGDYTVTVMIVDDDGEEASDTFLVEVSAPKYLRFLPVILH